MDHKHMRVFFVLSGCERRVRKLLGSRWGWPRAGLAVAGLAVLSLMAACQRKPAQLDTTQPEIKSGYTPSSNPGGVPGAGATDGAQGGSGSGDADDGAVLGGWAGLTDEQTQGWTFTDVAPSPSPGSSGSGAAGAPPATPNSSGSNAAALVTYNKEIKPLMERYCVSCHAAGKSRSSSPLTSYPSQSIAAQSASRVASGSMPKAGSPQMSAAEKDLFAQWAAGKFAQ
jgi:hypothetical protein